MAYQIERLGLNVLRRDKEALRRLAAAEGEAMSVVVRKLIRREAQKRGLLSTTQHQEALRDG
jgi:hypothetical protein